MNVEKFKILEKIKLSYLKHRGDVLRVSEELGIPLEYVKKVVNKIKKQEERDVRVLISHTIAQQILLGYQSRVKNYMDMLAKLENRDQVIVSLCCRAPVKVEIRNGRRVDVCMKCNKECNVEIVDKVTLYRIKKELLEQLREEDRLLVDFAEKMGYTSKEEVPQTVVYNRQNIAVITGAKGVDREVAGQLEQLSPRDREILIKELEKKIEEEERSANKENTG